MIEVKETNEGGEIRFELWGAPSEGDPCRKLVAVIDDKETAYLLGAAPALYNALRGLLALHQEAASNNPWYDGARAAIASAESGRDQAPKAARHSFTVSRGRYVVETATIEASDDESAVSIAEKMQASDVWQETDEPEAWNYQVEYKND